MRSTSKWIEGPEKRTATGAAAIAAILLAPRTPAAAPIEAPSLSIAQ